MLACCLTCFKFNPTFSHEYYGTTGRSYLYFDTKARILISGGVLSLGLVLIKFTKNQYKPVQYKPKRPQLK